MDENTIPISTFNEEEARARLVEFEAQLKTDHSEVFDLITTATKRFKTVKYGNVSIKIRAAVPLDILDEARRLRKEAEDVQDDDVSLLESLKPMYDMVAAICIESPWNNWMTWAIVDRKANGQVRTILGEIIRAIQDSEKKIVQFR